MIGRVSKELWTEVCNSVQEAVIKTFPKKKKCKTGFKGFDMIGRVSKNYGQRFVTVYRRQ